MIPPGKLTRVMPGPGSNPAEMTLLGHDLRAAMSDIIGGLRLIDPVRLDDGTRLQLGRIRAASEVLARLLEEGLAELVGEPEIAGSGPSNVHLSRLLTDIEARWSGRAREKGLDFTVSVAADLPQVLTLDRMALERILSNILSNAIKYTDTGGVAFTAETAPDGALTMTVRDEGPGFSAAALDRLFEFEGRPEDARKPGQGLGLHITKDMADRLGAGVAVANLPGRGAEVRLSLPASSFGPIRAAIDDVELPDLSRIRVLLAEDNATNQAIIGHMLRALGAEYSIAGDGVEALSTLEREDFDLALIDIEMPRMSGIDVIRSLRSRAGPLTRMPVLAVTSYVLRANREAIYAAGADGILAKPVGGIEAFGQAINAVLNKMRDPGPMQNPADAEAILDRARLDHLLDIAGIEGAVELLTRLVSDLGKVERGLLSGLSEPSFDEVRGHTHVLIALAGAVGADHLRRLADAMNTAAHRRDAPALKAMGHDTLRQLDRLILMISDELSVRGGVL